ncbi:MAG TPA: asparaginase [Candidatus Cloacimonetes bacterium]|nr:asparaginase [Candidatus Cloacimonadota bacterium]HEX37272.1 asparaginase [Candidatus Cloacimonadota bacterium]
MQPRLIVHGGAWSIPDERDDTHIKGVSRAISEVYPLLKKGLSAVDAVEKAVCVMEEDPIFDAGRGSVLNIDGEIEMDASIMDGKNLAFGAVAALQNILHPIKVAKLVMTETEHCLLVGTGAQKFAQAHFIPEVAPEELLTESELEFYRKVKEEKNYTTKIPFEPFPEGTVGAVALDIEGNLAAATSTGGTSRKIAGRVGDTPILGAGTFADNESGAASATGWGEAIMKSFLSKTACEC